MKNARSLGLAGASMPSSRALIVERDKTFAQRLDRCLVSLGFDVEITDNRREALESLKNDGVGVIVIAVERPKKAGFKVFTDVKRLIRNVPIVLTTATLPMAEMLMHQKLRLHADAYVDKRELSDRELLGTLNELLGLNFDPVELSRLAATSRSTRPRRSRSRHTQISKSGVATEAPEIDPDDEAEDRLEALDPALADLLADVDVSRVRVESDESDYAEAPEDEDEEEEFEDADEAIASLQDEVHRLQRELDHAQRSASSSPFSTDYLDLTNRIDAGERSSARLQRELDTRLRQVEALRAKLLQVAGRLLTAERLRDQSLSRLRKLEAQLGPLNLELQSSQERNEDLTRRLDEEHDRRSTLERQHASSVEALERRLSAEKRRAVEVEHKYRSELSSAEQRLQVDRETEVEQDRRRLDELREQTKRESEAALLTQAESLRKEQVTALEAKDSKWQHKLDELQNRHDLELKARQEERRKEIAGLQGSMEQALLRKEREMQQAYADAVAGEQLQQQQAFDYEEKIAELQREHAVALESTDGELGQRIEALRQEHANDLETRGEQHRQRVDQLIASHEQALGEAEQRQREAVEQALEDVRQEYVREAAERLSEFELAEDRHRKDLADADQRYQDQIELVKKLHEEELEQSRARHERERDRMRAEHEGEIGELETKILAEQDRAAAAQQAELQAEIEGMHQEQAQSRAAEREEMQVIIDALETVKGVDRSELPPDDAVLDPEITESTAEQNSALLRQIAEEMDRIGKTVNDAADEADGPERTMPSPGIETDSGGIRTD
jgi:hypothetical protein